MLAHMSVGYRSLPDFVAEGSYSSRGRRAVNGWFEEVGVVFSLEGRDGILMLLRGGWIRSRRRIGI